MSPATLEAPVVVIPDKILRSSSLPTLPAAAIQLLEVVNSPNVELCEVVGIVKNDPALTTRLLRSCNSASFAFRSKITSLERAIPSLGLQTIASLVLGFSLTDDALSKGPLSEHYNTIWTQSIAQAAAAELLADYFDDVRSDIAFQAGLLLDIGALALLKTIPTEYSKILELVKREQRNIREIELESLGFGHCEVGLALANKWGLPDVLHAPISKHHDDIGEQTEGGSLLILSAMASAIGDFFCRSDKAVSLNRICRMCDVGFPVEQPQIDVLIEAVGERIHERKDLFEFDFDDVPSANELMSEANDQLSDLAFRATLERTTAIRDRETVEAANRDLEERQEELVKQTNHDALTELFNRKFFDESLAIEVNRCSRAAAPIGVLFIDVDHFKQFNDVHGHVVGDQVLKLVAKNIRQCVRDSDLPCRYGGEEFVVFLNQPDQNTFEIVGERIRSQIEAEQIDVNGELLGVTVSVGSAIGVPESGDATFASRLLSAADSAMYEAKRQGRNQVRYRSLFVE